MSRWFQGNVGTVALQAAVRHLLVLATLFVAGLPASAAEPTAPRFSFSGFGTIGLLHSSEDQADFGASVFVPRGAGFSDSWSAAVDSRLGAQLSASFTPQLSATLQAVAEQGRDGEFLPHVEWANIKYQITPRLSVRVGRTALASFLASDFRKVGYANPWIRPPEEVYGLIPLYSGDGVDVSYTVRAGELSHVLLAGYGESDIRMRDGAAVKGRDVWTLSDTVEVGDWTLRLAWQSGRVKLDTLAPLLDGFRQFGPQGASLAEHYDPNGRVNFIAVGGTYDPGRWFATAEWGRADTHSAFGKRSSWYATSGYRAGNFTPYLTYATTRALSNTSDPGLSLADLPADSAAAAAGLNAALNAVLAAIPVQQSAAAGIRWDFSKNIAMSMQYDRINLGEASAGVLGNLQPAFEPGGNVHLFGFSVDFVW